MLFNNYLTSGQLVYIKINYKLLIFQIKYTYVFFSEYKFLF